MTTMEPPAKLQKTSTAVQPRKGSAAAGLPDVQAANIIVQFRSDDGTLTGAQSPPPSPQTSHVTQSSLKIWHLKCILNTHQLTLLQDSH